MRRFLRRHTGKAVIFGSLWAGAMGLSALEDWESALAKESGSALWARAKASRELSSLTDAIVGLEGAALERHASFAGRLLPGGDLAGEITSEDQAKLLEAWTAAAPSSGKAYRVWRIHQLTPDDAVKGVAMKALQALPKDLLPEKALSSLEGSGGGAIDPEKMARGKAVYNRVGICITCHQANGEGLAVVFPPLAGSEWLDGDKERQIKIVLKGLMGELEVKGEAYNGVMTPLEALLKDEEIADVLTYVGNEWGNKGPEITTEEVKAVREKTKGQQAPYLAADLLKAHPLQK